MDHIFYKRKKSNNTDTPNNAFAIECNSQVNTPSPYARGSANYGTVGTLSNNLLGSWGYLTFVFSGTNCKIYENGVKVGDSSVSACRDNDSPLVFGNNSEIASGTGGGAYVAQNVSGAKYDFALVNSILADNVSGGEGADPNMALPDNAALVSGYAGQSYGNVFANGTSALGEGSKSFEGSGASWFKDAANGNYRLSSGSPAIGAGTSYDGIVEDLDNARRKRVPASGCYEYRVTATMFSLRQDGF